MDFTTLLILSLAAARITRFIVSDKIFDTPRDILHLKYPPADSYFLEWHPEPKQSWSLAVSRARKDGLTYMARTFLKYRWDKNRIPRDPHWIGNLTSCTVCTSVWAAGFVYAAYETIPGAWYAILFLAIAQAVIVIERA